MIVFILVCLPLSTYLKRNHNLTEWKIKMNITYEEERMEQKKDGECTNAPSNSRSILFNRPFGFSFQISFTFCMLYKFSPNVGQKIHRLAWLGAWSATMSRSLLLIQLNGSFVRFWCDAMNDDIVVSHPIFMYSKYPNDVFF